ncbi:hypothetical protein B0J11DRAFT_499730 [Dendryphion nanum]|uniref:Uncharacterized protein n=1 Tax=Dendryphion nanum TaxID=256645 RepID=A0A9P9CXK6_9PLEO|nr:hypothetical protein B0J11DRAFT_499730 [Dendryphion nanum]
MPALVTIPQPDARELLPPLLACLSTATAVSEPPPALLPQLSPILRQRVQLLASNDWLSLLSWDSSAASRLSEVVRKIHVEPHPASGEIEVEDPDQTLYRRSDPETLHARLVLGEFGIIPSYLWCTGGDSGAGWKLSELRGIEDSEDGTQWFPTISEANEAGFRRTTTKTNGVTTHLPVTTVTQPDYAAVQEEDDDDGSYWAAYDRTPGETPQQKRSPAPVTNSRIQVGPTNDELAYFARYAQEVQPALDAHDPDEDLPDAGESTLDGNALNIQRSPPQAEPIETTNLGPYGYDSSLPPSFPNEIRKDSLDNNPSTSTSDPDRYAALNHPRPASSASSGSVSRLEREAESHSQAELAIKQHISTDMKSLFRLARTAGIEREEFERIIKRELEVLPLLERDH